MTAILLTTADSVVRVADADILLTFEGAFTPSRKFSQYTTANAAVADATLPPGFLPNAWTYAGGAWTLVDSAAKEAKDAERELQFNPIPPSVPAVAFRLALKQFDFLDDVEAVMKAAIDGGDDEVRVRWEYATVFERAHPLIESFRLALGKTDAEVDDLFRLAGKLA